METLANLSHGFSAALSLDALLFCFIGVSVGTFVGVLPGIGALAAIAMLLPLTYYLDPMVGLIMLAGIFYGAQYGSSTAAILLNIPGTATAAVTCLDGYPMARDGRAGVALFTTSITSFFGGMFAICLMMFFTPMLANLALSFNSAEYFSAMFLGLVAASTFSVGSPLKGLAMVVLGLALAIPGTDINSGLMRFTFGRYEMAEGFQLVAIAMGLFGISEILSTLVRREQPQVLARDITFRSLLPTRDDWRRIPWPSLRGAGIGSIIGALPGSGPSMATFIAYAVERRVAKDPSRFGKGAVEGVAAPESANNAAVQAAFIPTLSLGVPGDAVMAILLGALMIHGIIPGPQFIQEQSTLFWGLVASFWIGNIMLLVLNVPLIGLWVRLLTVPYRVLYPTMLFLICVGVYSVRSNPFDVGVALAFGILGFFMNMLRYPTAPVLLGFILGPLIEEHFKRALLVSRGDLAIFIERPISAGLLALALGLLLLSLWQALRAWRRRNAVTTSMET
ncbi:tripartite tricarboxylate transporter permease [Chelativorans sp. YIM 93263]|uniref:tripartite tricarboxylate transporter permease n=1 Tax=Chelativorans sp. YIM 93263 TaxID=2906648 RepID=UPI00237812E9|nr:tripartite tricarboxylate transporter permease [Chelativorans sp. YIM 93263]